MSMAHGQGVYTNTQGDTYIGQWKLDRKHGRGQEKWMNGCKYEGQYFEGERHGCGEYSFRNPITVYKGNWRND
jgi:hypothetical protein